MLGRPPVRPLALALFKPSLRNDMVYMVFTVYRRELMPKGEEENDVGGNQSRESLTSLP